MTTIDKMRFVCGTKAVKRVRPTEWIVVCATCDEPQHGDLLSYTWSTAILAQRHAVRCSMQPCSAKHPCGAR